LDTTALAGGLRGGIPAIGWIKGHLPDGDTCPARGRKTAAARCTGPLHTERVIPPSMRMFCPVM
jgi:hypothetical protein